MIFVLRHQGRSCYLAPSSESRRAPGRRVTDARQIRSLFTLLCAEARNRQCVRACLFSEPGHQATTPLSDAQVTAAAERLLLSGRWLLLQGPPPSGYAAPSAGKTEASEWVPAEDQGITSNDQGLALAITADVEEPMSLEMEVEEQPTGTPEPEPAFEEQEPTA